MGSSRASLAATLASLDSAAPPQQQGPPDLPTPELDDYFCHAVVNTDVMLVDTVKVGAPEEPHTALITCRQW